MYCQSSIVATSQISITSIIVLLYVHIALTAVGAIHIDQLGV